jgi:hypothetical protein
MNDSSPSFWLLIKASPIRTVEPSISAPLLTRDELDVEWLLAQTVEVGNHVHFMATA